MTVVEFELAASTAQLVRFAVSPAQELFHAVQVAARPERNTELSSWAGRASVTLAEVSVPELVAALSGDSYAPDFLTPPPANGRALGWDEQLEEAAQTPAAQVAQELALSFAGRRWPLRLPTDPSAARDLLVGQFAACWKPLLHHSWQAIKAILEADIRHRAEQYAAGGVSGVLGSIHPSVAFNDGTLSVGAHHPRPLLHLDERGLLLLPTVFGPPGEVGPMLIGYWQPSLVYPARGRARFSLGQNPAPPGLAALVGPTRARVLLALAEPDTTTGLSARLAVSPSTVSEHLHHLDRAGLCTRQRSGRTVIYRLNERGQDLLAAYDASS